MVPSLRPLLRILAVTLCIAGVTAVCNFVIDPYLSGRPVSLAGFTSPRVATVAAAALFALLLCGYTGAKLKLVSLFGISTLIAISAIGTSLATRFALGTKNLYSSDLIMYAKHLVATFSSSLLILFLASLLWSQDKDKPETNAVLKNET